MLLPAILLFFLFLLLSAFFSSSETAFVAANPFTLDYLEKQGAKRASLVKKLMARADNLLATILIGNTLVNTAAASVATYIFVSLIPDEKQAILLATGITTLMILFFSEINPKTFAAYNPLKVAFWFVHPLRGFLVVFYPFVKAFTFISRFFFQSSRNAHPGLSRSLNEEEIRVVLTTGIKGMSSLRKKMISGILDIGSLPLKAVMVPRPQVKAIEVTSSFDQILDIIRSAEFSRFPVYRGRLDNIEGVIHAKDIIPYIIDNKEFDIKELLRKPLYLPESATIENALVRMQENTVHLAFVVDEFGNVDGIITLEDIIEEIVGEIQDEYDPKAEIWVTEIEKNVFIVKGKASIKEINQQLPLDLPEKGDYTTLAGFFLFKYGRIPAEGDMLVYQGHTLVVEKMNKRHISLVRILLKPTDKKDPEHEDHRRQ